MILEPKKIKPVTVCIVFPSICHKVMGPLQTFISLNIPVPRVEWASLVAQTLKESARNTETWVQSLGWEDALEEGVEPTPVFLPGESPWTEEPGGL